MSKVIACSKMIEIQKSFCKSFIFKNYQTPRENGPIQIKGCIQMTLETYSIALIMETMQIKSVPRLQAWGTNTDYQHCWQRQGNQPLSHQQSLTGCLAVPKLQGHKLSQYHILGICTASHRSSSRKQCQHPPGMSCLIQSVSIMYIHAVLKKIKIKELGNILCADK